MRWHLFFSAIVACVIASPALPAKPGPGSVPWVGFDDPSSLAVAHAIVASELPGDAIISALTVDGGMLVVNGTFGLDNGSRWSTLGAEIAPASVEAGPDLSAANVLRIRLASAVARPLRVRIKGSDRGIGNAGCYPVVVQMVAMAPADYMIPLSAFQSPGWCGPKAVSIEQTLRSVERVEVTANDAPAGAVSFSVGRIDFLKDGRSEVDRNWQPTSNDNFEEERVHSSQIEDSPGAAAFVSPAASRGPARASMPASAASGRRRPAGAGQSVAASAATPSRRVVCEHSARYELMLCY